MSSKLSSADRQALQSACNEGIQWMAANLQATEEQLVHKKVEIENICKPIVMRLYTSEGPNVGRQFPQHSDSNNDQGPVIEEAD